MRISPISISQYNRPVNNHNIRKNTPVQQNPTFKGWGGGIGSAIGTFAGLGLGSLITLATGGIAAPLLLASGGCFAGAIGGEAVENKFKREG